MLDVKVCCIHCNGIFDMQLDYFKAGSDKDCTYDETGDFYYQGKKCNHCPDKKCDGHYYDLICNLEAGSKGYLEQEGIDCPEW